MTLYLGDYSDASDEEKRKFLEELKHPNGSKIKTIRIKFGSLDNKINLSKNKELGYRGQYFESDTDSAGGTSQHGYYFYKCLKKNKKGERELDKEGREVYDYKIQPVYAFLSPYKKKKELQEQGNILLFDGRLLSRGTWLKFTKDIELEGKAPLFLEKGLYKIVSCNKKMNIRFENNIGVEQRNENGKSVLSFKSILEKYEDSIHVKDL